MDNKVNINIWAVSSFGVHFPENGASMLCKLILASSNLYSLLLDGSRLYFMKI